MSSTVGKRIGELLILGVYLAVDVSDVWPKSHGLCLALVAIGVTGLVLLDGMFEQYFPTKRICLTGFIVSLSCGVVYVTAPYLLASEPPALSTRVEVTPERSKTELPSIPLEDLEVYGILKPADEPTPPNGCDRVPMNQNALKVLFGDNTITHDGLGSFTAIAIGSCNAISMTRTEQGIFVDANLFDREGKGVVSIRSNYITALNGEHYSVRQSRDGSRLSVKTTHGMEIFYIRYLNPTTVQFRGYLGCARGPMIHVQDGEPIAGVLMSGACLANAHTGIQINSGR